MKNKMTALTILTFIIMTTFLLPTPIGCKKYKIDNYPKLIIGDWGEEDSPLVAYYNTYSFSKDGMFTVYGPKRGGVNQGCVKDTIYGGPNPYHIKGDTIIIDSPPYLYGPTTTIFIIEKLTKNKFKFRTRGISPGSTPFSYIKCH